MLQKLVKILCPNNLSIVQNTRSVNFMITAKERKTKTKNIKDTLLYFNVFKNMLRWSYTHKFRKKSNFFSFTPFIENFL